MKKIKEFIKKNWRIMLKVSGSVLVLTIAGIVIYKYKLSPKELSEITANGAIDGVPVNVVEAATDVVG